MENKSGITPTGDLVLLLCPPVASVTAGGIVIPEEAKERQQRATRIGYLLAMGEVAVDHPRMQGLQTGDMLLIPRYAADFVPIDGVDYLLLRADSVLGKLDKMPDYQFQKAAVSTLDAFGHNAPPEPSRIALPS
jgi:chaperonin GroES